MKVYIAEKPSLGRAIAQGLGGGKAEDGCIRTKSGIVTWCFGHILEQYDPQDYDSRYARWQIADLPIVPNPWKNKVRKDAKKQFTIIKKLVETADEIVNCGDPDREGQLLIDEVLEELHVLGKKPIYRLLLSALDEKSVQAALNDLRPNDDFIGLRSSALARSRADWLIGYNLSRMYTCRAREAGYDEVISVGRVQTPTFGLVALRELEIQNFQPTTFFTPYVTFHHANGDIRAKWNAREMDGVDGEGRVLDRKLADALISKTAATASSIVSVGQKRGHAYPNTPIHFLPFKSTQGSATDIRHSRCSMPNNLFTKKSSRPIRVRIAAISPKTSSRMRRRKGKDGFFWGCSGFPSCKTTMRDQNGRPVMAKKRT